MADGKQDKENIQASDNSVAVGNVSVAGSIAGNLTIGNTGYTAEQVSTLITQISTTFQPKPFDGRSPYKGLDYFEEQDAELFFGREKLVDDLVSRVKVARTLFVTGPSGSGKSSLVRAGLVHSLKQGCIKNSERWLYGTMRPGRGPIAELARVTSGLADSTNAEDEICARAVADPSIFRRWCEIALGDGREKRVVLFIDQFEEVFTQVNKEIANTFIDLLNDAVTTENGRVMLIFAMRSDFVANCAVYPQLNALLNRQFVQIGAMQQEELVSAMAQPALRVGLRIDPDLIAQIINDMQDEPGALPLMQFALKDLFDTEQAKGEIIALTLKDYLQRGGIRKALERHADDSFNKLDSHEQELARSIFSGLIEIGRGTADTRRTALVDELVPAGGESESVSFIIRKLADARLVTTDEIAGKDIVTLSHEKLIDAWPWLKKLVNENRDIIALQNKITSDAKEWEEHEFDPSYLYTGARLITVQENLKAKKFVLSATSEKFIREGQAQQWRSRRRVITTGALIFTVLTLLLVVGLLVLPYIQESLAKARAREDKIALTGGEFYMGSSDPNAIAEGERSAWLAKIPSFYIDKYEVSNYRYGLCMKYGVCTPPGDPAYRDAVHQSDPVIAVNVYQANAYCQWLGGRLPTELEWVRAARGLDNQRIWPWGNEPPKSELVNMFLTSYAPTGPAPVASYSAGSTPEGVLNLVGNASEWTSSYYQDAYHNGRSPYDYSSYWNGAVDTYDGTKSFIQLGGGWKTSITFLTQIFPTKSFGYAADADTGFRCVYDLQ